MSTTEIPHCWCYPEMHFIICNWLCNPVNDKPYYAITINCLPVVTEHPKLSSFTNPKGTYWKLLFSPPFIFQAIALQLPFHVASPPFLQAPTTLESWFPTSAWPSCAESDFHASWYPSPMPLHSISSTWSLVPSSNQICWISYTLIKTLSCKSVNMHIVHNS